ncbi:alpha/beta hydrolase family protein [Demequina maris]|uniref:alpha/beta hydrolase family protein n=1 Tax=Demequina maris TaxID=1638982 RepID=UPI000784FE95|nr:prolyl oligopeptidase family serine peptidase [Demequina maris]
MSTVRRAVHVALLASVVVTAAVAGIGARAGDYLLGFTAPGSAGGSAYDGLAYASPGPHGVGVRRIGPSEAPVAMTVWYPAAGEPDEEPSARYSYALAVLDEAAPTAVATYAGSAVHDAPAASGGPYPLVLLSAGFAITPESYAWLAEHLASHGMVVVAPRHEETLDPSQLSEATIERPETIAEARRYITGDAAPMDLRRLVDADRVAVLGHSLGGYAALAAAGARPDPEAFRSGCTGARLEDDPIVFLCDALEPRFDEIVAANRPEVAPVDAVVSLAGDAAMFGADGLSAITAPLLAIGGTADRDSPFEWSTRLAYDGAASAHKVEVALEGAGHLVFAGGCGSVRRIVLLVPLGLCDDPGWDRADARTVVRHHVAGFLLAELAVDPSGAVTTRAVLVRPADAPR